MFGLLIPGSALIYQFNPTEDPNTWVVTIPNPADVSEFAFFITEPMPDQMALGIYYSHMAPFASWQFLGAVNNIQVSQIFKVGWPWMVEVASQPVVSLKLVLEPEAFVIEKLQVTPPVDVRKVINSYLDNYVHPKELARKTALNLYRYLESFNLISTSELQQAIDSWFKRFEEKYSRDPNFMLRTE